MSTSSPPARSRSIVALLPVGFAALLVLTVWLRFGGRTSDSDTATITQAARGVLDQELARPHGGLAYTNGFSYPVLVATMSQVTGLSIETVQTVILPWLLVALALVAFVTFRSIAGTARAGAISALLLLVQPDFLFVTQRGSHEKVTWLLVLVLVYCLVSTFRQPQVSQVSSYIMIFYVCGFALICTNAFFGSSFIASVFFVLLGTTIVGPILLRDLSARRIPRRFTYPLVTLGCFSFLFMFHIYPVAQHGLQSLDTTLQRVAALYLSTEPGTPASDTEAGSSSEAVATTDQGSDATSIDSATSAPTQRPTAVSPYATIAGTWISLRVYFLLTTFTWVLIIWAVLTWFLTAARFFRRGVYLQEIPLFVAWAFAAATGLQVALSILGDTTGSLGSNVQLRLFPAFTLFAVPLVVTAPSIRHRVFRATTAGWLAVAGHSRLRERIARLISAVTVAPVLRLVLSVRSLKLAERTSSIRMMAAVGVFSGFAVAALLKATNDPLVSNKWTFYSAAEFRAMVWVERSIPITSLVWSEFDERLATVARAYVDESPLTPGIRRWTAGSSWESDSVRYALVSDISAARSSRLAVPLPGSAQDDRIYDNGRVQIVHSVPETPFQA